MHYCIQSAILLSFHIRLAQLEVFTHAVAKLVYY